jgi:hypothetical protein
MLPVLQRRAISGLRAQTHGTHTTAPQGHPIWCKNCQSAYAGSHKNQDSGNTETGEQAVRPGSTRWGRPLSMLNVCCGSWLCENALAGLRVLLWLATGRMRHDVIIVGDGR